MTRSLLSLIIVNEQIHTGPARVIHTFPKLL